jgi:hypothetical protein
VIANLMLAAWAILWIGLLQTRGGIRDPLDAAAFASLVVFPCLLVLAARHLP